MSDRDNAVIENTVSNSAFIETLEADIINKHLTDLSESELHAAFVQAYKDLGEAAENAYNTPWHIACFAATITYLHEARKRGIKTLDILASL